MTTVVGAAVGVTPGLAIHATHAYFVGPTRADVSRIALARTAADEGLGSAPPPTDTSDARAAHVGVAPLRTASALAPTPVMSVVGAPPARGAESRVC